MFCIRFTKNEPCDVSGSPAELRAIEEAIKSVASNGRGSITFAGDALASAKPYDRLLSRLIITVTTGPVCATVEEDTLSIIGGPEFLKCLASFFAFDDETPAGYHAHHEYFEDNPAILPNSAPLVICVAGKPISQDASQSHQVT